jgi:hypothetical protein
VFGSNAPGGGFLNCALSGMPVDRFGSTAKIRLMIPPKPWG